MPNKKKNMLNMRTICKKYAKNMQNVPKMCKKYADIAESMLTGLRVGGRPNQYYMMQHFQYATWKSWYSNLKNMQKICKSIIKYAVYVNYGTNMQNMHTGLCWCWLGLSHESESASESEIHWNINIWDNHGISLRYLFLKSYSWISLGYPKTPKVRLSRLGWTRITDSWQSSSPSRLRS